MGTSKYPTIKKKKKKEFSCVSTIQIRKYVHRLLIVICKNKQVFPFNSDPPYIPFDFYTFYDFLTPKVCVLHFTTTTEYEYQTLTLNIKIENRIYVERLATLLLHMKV